jgi:hypothetical protein
MDYSFFRYALILAIVIFFGCSKEKEIVKYYENGTLKETWVFQKDTLTGQKKQYWHNGQVHNIFNYENGKLNGEFLAYYEDGKIARSCLFFDNILRGPALRFYASENVIQKKTYYLDVQGKQYMYYDSIFNERGEFVSQDRTVFADFSCNGNNKKVQLSFVDDFDYDSAYVITGMFSENFSMDQRETFDTLKMKDLAVELTLNDRVVNEGVFRGKCIFFNGTVFGDSTRMDVKNRYFEEPIIRACLN